MTRWRTAVVLVAVLAGVVLGGSPAMAGNWAVTILDPLPDRLDVNRPYTVGFWVLQHGSHPYSGKLDQVGLRLVDDKGSATVFPGAALPEPAHYAAAIILPRAGTWRIYGVQGPFADYLVGTLTVPGTLRALPVPQPAQVGADDQPWGAIRPPQMPVDPGRDPFTEPVATASAAGVPAAVEAVEPPVRRTAARGDATGSARLTGVALVMVAVALGFALLLTYRTRPVGMRSLGARLLRRGG
jgi:hypothetical protein